MTTASTLRRGRESFARRAWADAYAELSSADGDSALDPDDVERLATAAYLLGRDADSTELWTRAHHAFLGLGEAERAARCAFWLALGLVLNGEEARGGGWLSRARRLLDDSDRDCVEQGYLLVPVGLHCMAGGDGATAYATFGQAVEAGGRFGDPDLTTLGLLGRGQALIRLGEVAEGVAFFDEAMVAVTAGEVSAIPAGIVYCAVIDECQRILDLRRAHAWTEALSGWCASQPELVPYRGECLVHRAQIMQHRGAWPEAMEEARRACEWLSRPPRPALGVAFYQQAELHRLRGEFSQAEEGYRQANQRGRTPQPGLALLRLAEGRVGAAEAAIRGAVDEERDRGARARLLAARVEIELVAGDVPGARAAADELHAVAADVDAPMLRALAAHAGGAVLLAEGAERGSLDASRAAWAAYQELEAPYEAARARVLVGLACRALRDDDTAEMELDAACRTFRELGAATELARAEGLFRDAFPAAAPAAASGLTAREIQVLRLVSAGKANRAIAAELFLSEKTVARHVSNILTKLGLPSRAAATAYAYQHDLV